MPALGALAVSKEQRGPLLNVESRELLNSKKRMGLDLIVILKERQEQK